MSSLIKNLVKPPNDSDKKPKKVESDLEDDKEKPRRVVKSATDLQRLKLEKLMSNPEKPVVIAESRKEKDYMASVPTFVRNVMGSSAGAGSGEFHVYRHLRRKEYARQKIIQAKSSREEADDCYQRKLEENRRIAEEKTAKKRAKRLKKKQRAKKPRLPTKTDSAAANESESASEAESDDANAAVATEEPADPEIEEEQSEPTSTDDVLSALPQSESENTEQT